MRGKQSNSQAVISREQADKKKQEEERLLKNEIEDFFIDMVGSSFSDIPAQNFQIKSILKNKHLPSVDPEAQSILTRMKQTNDIDRRKTLGAYYQADPFERRLLDIGENLKNIYSYDSDDNEVADANMIEGVFQDVLQSLKELHQEIKDKD